jgi:hypothetical protein
MQSDQSVRGVETYKAVANLQLKICDPSCQKNHNGEMDLNCDPMGMILMHRDQLQHHQR